MRHRLIDTRQGGSSGVESVMSRCGLGCFQCCDLSCSHKLVRCQRQWSENYIVRWWFKHVSHISNSLHSIHQKDSLTKRTAVVGHIERKANGETRRTRRGTQRAHRCGYNGSYLARANAKSIAYSPKGLSSGRRGGRGGGNYLKTDLD